MDHNFNIEVAKRLGIAPAVILNNLYWWIEKNRANEKHYHDGYYWTYNSRKAYVEQFPYLTERQIEYALRKLIDEGYIITGNYNKASFDRTLWYAITKRGYSILQNCEMEETNLGNASTENVKPIPNKNTNKKSNNTLPTVEEQAPETKTYKNYGEIYTDPIYSEIRIALERFVKSLSNKHGYNPRVSTVVKFADNLRKLSSNNPELAMRIVEQSIEKGWKDLYKLKDRHTRDAVSTPFNSEKDVLATGTDGKTLVY